MGRIKTAQVKRVTFDLLRLHQDKFKQDYEHNKLAVDQLTVLHSARIRNRIAGYVTKLMREPENLVLKIK